jgi:hypothetical protein
MMLQLVSPLTPGEIARRCKVPLHRVSHILATRDIKPIGRAGIVRIYDEAALERVHQELAKVDAKRGKAAPAP